MTPPGRIVQLDSLVIDSIAAGEVIERPASVLKELIENSLDAGSSLVRIALEGAGRRLIQVEDDGAGIPAEDLDLAFSRHATSKLRSVHDLESVTTLGFRGEALSSLAAVARVKCVSAEVDGMAGLIEIEAGRVVDRGQTSRSRGTTIRVSDLFRWTPARFKFLRSDLSEAAALSRVVTDYAIAYPEVAFELQVDRRRVLSTPGADDLVETVLSLTRAFGDDPVALAGEAHGFSVGGLAGLPERSRPNRTWLLLFVNRRRVHNRTLAVAVERAYRGLLMQGRYPVAVVLLTCDPALVDVNVHPAKREVRLRDEPAAFAAVERSVGRALAGRRGFAPWSESAPDTRTQIPDQAADQAADQGTDQARLQRIRELGRSRGSAEGMNLGEPGLPYAPSHEAVADRVGGGAPLRLIGQAFSRYILAEGEAGLVLVDQHAAHERVLFDTFCARQAGALPGPVQSFLIPLLVDLAPEQLSALEAVLAELRQAGLELELFGERTLRITGAPPELSPGRVQELLIELAGEVRSSSEFSPQILALRSLACHSAVRFDQFLAREEMQKLLLDLAATPNGATCPHGRPTSILLTHERLETELRRR